MKYAKIVLIVIYCILILLVVWAVLNNFADAAKSTDTDVQQQFVINDNWSPVYKIVDNHVTCYYARGGNGSASISCVHN